MLRICEKKGLTYLLSRCKKLISATCLESGKMHQSYQDKGCILIITCSFLLYKMCGWIAVVPLPHLFLLLLAQ